MKQKRKQKLYKNILIKKNVLCIKLFSISIFRNFEISKNRNTFIRKPSLIGIILLWIITNENSIITQILEFAPISFIGKISYGLYIWQDLFCSQGIYGKMWIQRFPQNFILTFVIAIISYYTIEKYFLKLKEKKSIQTYY